jgi:hypothetical protein
MNEQAMTRHANGLLTLGAIAELEAIINVMRQQFGDRQAFIISLLEGRKQDLEAQLSREAVGDAGPFPG